MSKYPQTPMTCLNNWVAAEKDYGLLPKTLDKYYSSGKYLINLMLDNDREPLPYRWTGDDVAFLRNLWDERKLKVKTQLGYHFVFCALAQWYDNFYPLKYRVKWPPLDITNRRWLELEQAKEVIRHPKTPRQEVCISLMLEMLRRRIEVLRARVCDFKWDAADPYMDVDGKGHKKHRMPFSPEFDRILGTYLDDRWYDVLECHNDHVAQAEAFDSLIIWRRGNKVGTYDPIKATGFDKAITNAVSADCGILFSNHDLRRTGGRELYYTAEVELVTIMGYYNHANIDQTLWYIGADQKRMSEAIKKLPFRS